VVFHIRGVDPTQVVSAFVDPRLHRRGSRVPLSPRRVRRAIRRGRLTVGLRRLHLSRKRLSRMRRKPRLVITTAPDTWLTSSPPGTTTGTDALFSFRASEPRASFECRLDGAAWTACHAPKAFSSLRAGSHRFAVRALDSVGNADPSPAGLTWTIESPLTPRLSCGKVAGWVLPQPQPAPGSYLYTPPSDGQAAACVTPTLEALSRNAQANSYVPSDADLADFRAARFDNGETQEESAWYPRYVTGRPGLVNPSTDDLIEWAAHKWGIPEDWLRAEAMQESDWVQAARGDRRTVTPDCYLEHPPLARIPGLTEVFESLGIMQVKWRCGAADGAGTEPLRWKSTAFNVDFQASIVRFYYDNPYGKRSSWGDAAYRPLDDWAAIGAWFSPYPYDNGDSLAYISRVQQHLAARDWPG
jgi:hypothetical protein